MSLFTDEHYEVIARVLAGSARRAAGQPAHLGFDSIAAVRVNLKIMFRADNPGFNMDKFAKSCEEHAP